MGKHSPASKQNTLTSAAQTTTKLQDEIVAELTMRITNLKKNCRKTSKWTNYYTKCQRHTHERG